MSGSRVFTSGVGTAIETASTAARHAGSVAAVSRPSAVSRAMAAAGTSRTWDSPATSRSTVRWFTS